MPHQALRSGPLLNLFIVPNGSSPMSDTIQTSAAVQRLRSDVSMRTVTPEHPKVLAREKRSGRFYAPLSLTQYCGDFHTHSHSISIDIRRCSLKSHILGLVRPSQRPALSLFRPGLRLCLLFRREVSVAPSVPWGMCNWAKMSAWRWTYVSSRRHRSRQRLPIGIVRCQHTTIRTRMRRNVSCRTASVIISKGTLHAETVLSKPSKPPIPTLSTGALNPRSP